MKKSKPKTLVFPNIQTKSLPPQMIHILNYSNYVQYYKVFKYRTQNVTKIVPGGFNY